MASIAERTMRLYARVLTDQVKIRRYTGTGVTRSATDYPSSCYARANVEGIAGTALVGAVTENTYVAIVLLEDLVGLSLPITTADKMIYNGRELGIMFADNASRSAGDELIAYTITAKG